MKCSRCNKSGILDKIGDQSLCQNCQYDLRQPKSITEQVRAIPRFAIKMVVNNRHVGTPDAEIVAEWNERCDKAGNCTPYQRRRVVQYALAVHHVNQQLVRDFRL